MIWPWFERFDAIKPYSNGTFAIPYDELFPKLVRTWSGENVVSN